MTSKFNKIIDEIEDEFINQIQLNELLVIVNTETNNNLLQTDKVLFNQLQIINQQKEIIENLKNKLDKYKKIIKISTLTPIMLSLFLLLTNLL
mgnify:CR=1 FL=1